MVIRDIERNEIEFVSKTLNCLPIAHVDHMKPEKLGTADLVEEVEVSIIGRELLAAVKYTRHRFYEIGISSVFCDFYAYYYFSGWQRPRCQGDGNPEQRPHHDGAVERQQQARHGGSGQVTTRCSLCHPLPCQQAFPHHRWVNLQRISTL